MRPAAGRRQDLLISTCQVLLAGITRLLSLMDAERLADVNTRAALCAKAFELCCLAPALADHADGWAAAAAACYGVLEGPGGSGWLSLAAVVPNYGPAVQQALRAGAAATAQGLIAMFRCASACGAHLIWAMHGSSWHESVPSACSAICDTAPAHLSMVSIAGTIRVRRPGQKGSESAAWKTRTFWHAPVSRMWMYTGEGEPTQSIIVLLRNTCSPTWTDCAADWAPGWQLFLPHYNC
jgi:hypothetical protein